MHERIEKIKIHLCANKDRYIIGGGCLVIGVVGTLVFKQKSVVSQQIKNIALLNWKSPHTSTNVQIPARGQRGTVVIRDKTGEAFGSIKQASEELNISRTRLSQHLRGLQDSVNGETFTSLGENLSEQITVST